MVAAMPVSYKKKKDIVYNLIRSEIMNGLLPMGEHLVISALAARSRGLIPFRCAEALPAPRSGRLGETSRRKWAPRSRKCSLNQTIEINSFLLESFAGDCVALPPCLTRLPRTLGGARKKELPRAGSSVQTHPAIWSFSMNNSTVSLRDMRVERVHCICCVWLTTVAPPARQMLSEVFAKRLAALKRTPGKLYQALVARKSG
jgi:hypothetical protein